MRIRTTYNGPDAAGRGARIRVRLLGEAPRGVVVGQRTATYPYDYASTRPHRDAARRFAVEALGLDEPVVEQIHHGGVGGKLWEVAP